MKRLAFTLLVIASAACSRSGSKAITGAPAETGASGALAASASPNSRGSASGSAAIVAAGPAIATGDPGAADVRFEIRSDRNVQAISPLIYGTNMGEGAAQMRYTLLRYGGNRLTAYNWENNASNAGSDYLFQNDAHLSDSNVPGQAVAEFVKEASAARAAALVTIPIVDYVASDKNGGGDVRGSGPSYLATRFKRNRAVKGNALSLTPNAKDDYVNQDEFVNWLKATYGRTQILFSLDNEPDLWSLTHEEVHPKAVTYEELGKRSITFAKMIKAVWPGAQVAGLVSYGWNGFVDLQEAPDAKGKGDAIEYWLKTMRAAEAKAGTRLIDYLDLHWYPEAQGGGVRITEPSTTAAVVAARLQAPRSLWDAGYREQSWIMDVLGEPIRLIPRIKAKIAANYPGTKLAFSEWNYGGGTHISGALASADALGIFGREGVALAAHWKGEPEEPFTDAAFKAFRNFDGAAAAFGDTSIFASSSDAALASVYASLDAKNPKRVVIIAINKSREPKTAGITLAHPISFAKLKLYTLSGSKAGIRAGNDISALATNAFRHSMPAQSISVLVPQP